MPLFIAARVLENPPPALKEAAAQLRYAPWLVANLHIKAALHDRPGAAPSWDSVIYNPGGDARFSGLGYVDAGHQNLDMVPGARLCTHSRGSTGAMPCWPNSACRTRTCAAKSAAWT